MTEQNKNALSDLIIKLNAAGEDKVEMKFWQDIFETLTLEQQQELSDILKKELERLNAAK